MEGGGGGFHACHRAQRSSSGVNQHLNFEEDNLEHDTRCNVREQEHFMPIANVIRIMRKVLPTHAKIADDAKETMQECVSEYISFITSEANERCQREQRKTITAEDVLWAMSKLGFYDYIEPLIAYLRRHRALEGNYCGTTMRGEPFLKRVIDMGPLSQPAYGPAFHLGLFGGMPGGGSEASTSHLAMADCDPYALYK